MAGLCAGQRRRTGRWVGVAEDRRETRPARTATTTKVCGYGSGPRAGIDRGPRVGRGLRSVCVAVAASSSSFAFRCFLLRQESEGSGSRKRMSDEAGLGDGAELTDTATSPTKLVSVRGAQQGEKGAQNQLILEPTQKPVNTGGEVPPLPPQYIPPREQKRMKKTARSTCTTPEKPKAASPAEDRRS